MATTNDIYSLYLAYFGRPPDAVGFAAAQSKSVAQLQSEFSASAESAALLGSTNLATQVNNIYVNAFGRSAETAGLLYWVGEIAAGRVTLSQAAFTIVSSALNDDRTTVTNKITAATAFYAQVVASPANIIGYSGDAASTQARTFLSSVTSSAASVTAAVAGVAAAVTSTVAAGSAATVTPGSTFTLTTGTDTGSAFTGGSGADTFNADLSAAGANTLNTLDRLDGGAGVDTLNVVLAADAAPASLANIETIVATGSGGAARALNLVNAPAASSVSVSGSTAGSVVTVSNIAAGAALNVVSQGVDSVFAYASTSGTQSVNLGVSGVTGAAGITIAGVETVTTTATGSASSYTLNTAGAGTLNFAGSAAQTVALNAAVLGVSRFDAAAATGAVTLTTIDQTALAATVAVTVIGGSGNDSLTLVESNNLTVNGGGGDDTIVMAAIDGDDSVDGGAGTDTLSTVNAQANVLDAVAAGSTKVTNVETLTITDALDGTVDVARISSGINTVNLTLATAGGVIFTAGDAITGPAGSLTVNVGGSGAGNTTTATGALTLTDTGTGTTDALTLNNTAVNSTTDLNVNVFNGQDVTSAGYENVTLNGGAKAFNSPQTTIGTLTITPDSDSAAVSLTITGNNDVVINSVSTSSTGLLTINGSAITGLGDSPVLRINGTTSGSGGTQSITGSAGNDHITVGNFRSTVVGGAGNDTIAGGTAADNIQGGDGIDTITDGGGNDTISGGAGNDAITISGTSVNVDAGDGDDTVNADATLSTGDVVNGGAGNDTLAIDAAATAESSQGVSNFEFLRADTALTQDMVQFTGNAGFTRLISNIAGNVTFNNVAAAATELRALTHDGGDTLTFDRLLDNATNAVTIGTFADANTTINTLVANDEETINVVAGGATTAGRAFEITALTAADLVTLNVSGATNFTTTIGASATALATVNASANTGTVVISAAAATSAVAMTGSASAASTLTGGSGADVITGGSAADNLTGGANADTINGGGGGDTIVGGTGSDNLTGGEGADTITGGANNDTIVLTETVAAADRVVYADTAANNGVDTVTGFTTGTGGDVLDFIAFLGGATVLRDVDSANPGAGVTLADNTVARLVDIVDGNDITTAAGLLAALNGGEYANIDATVAGATQYIFLTATSATATTFNVFFATSVDATANFDAVTLVGTLAASGALSTIVAANAIGA
jgi:S-layer protein